MTFQLDPIFETLRRRVMLGVAAAMMIAGAGCSDDDKVTPPTPENPRKSIAGVMQELIDAYQARDIARYAALFDNSSFVFVFDPTDVQGDPDIPPNWDWNEEENATRNMFEASLVERIELNFRTQSPTPATEQDLGERPFPPGTMKLLATEVELSVDTRDPAGGENIIYRVGGVQETFFLYPDSLETVDGVPAWKIFEWRERKVGPIPTIDTTWGAVKNNYR